MNTNSNYGSSSPSPRQARAWSGAAVICTCSLLAGCGTVSISEQTYLGSAYQPKNIFRQSATLPESLRRVAVLPLTVAANNSASEAGRDDLEMTLRRELSKRAAFELVEVLPAQLQQWTGRSSWLADEKLPADFFAKLRESLACDAVLFSRLTHFQPYKPVVIGWRFNLVDSRESKTWWSADEVFDSGQTGVVNGARRYSLEHFKEGASATDSQFILHSPQRFGQYTLHTLMETVPTR